MPEEVSAVFGHFTGRAVEDQSVVSMLYPNGALGVAEASFLGSSARFVVEAHGTEGSLLYDPSGGLRTRHRGAEQWSSAQVSADGGSPFGRWVELSSAGRTDPGECPSRPRAERSGGGGEPLGARGTPRATWRATLRQLKYDRRCRARTRQPEEEVPREYGPPKAERDGKPD